jgi:hypothetical protein
VRRALALLAVLATAGCAVIHRAGANFWELERGPSSQAPEPATTAEAVLQVYAARTVGWRGLFAVHTWIVVKPSGAAAYTRYEVIGWEEGIELNLLTLNFGVELKGPALKLPMAGRLGPS